MKENEVIISPSILSADFSQLGKEISLLNDSSCEYIHIDVMDGHFVPNLTMGPKVIKSIRHLTKKVFDVHLMINPVKKFLKEYIDSGADILTIHYEIEDDVKECLEIIKKKNIKAGLSIKPDTKFDVIKPYLGLIDLVLIMTVEPGFSGQTFMYSQIEKIKKVKEILSGTKIKIQVDGGINFTTARDSILAGADILVSGSTIFKDNNYQKNIEKLKHLNTV